MQSFYKKEVSMILTEREKPAQGEQAPDWVSISEAATRLGVSGPKLSRWVKSGRIAHKKDPRDERVTFVDMNELDRIFNPPNA